MMCGKCTKVTASLVALVGVLFLLVDVGVWNFWGISWYTAAFLIAGITMCGKSMCSSCQSCGMQDKKKKR